MYKINRKIAITNGERPFIDFSDTRKSNYANGTVYYIVDGVLVIETDVIITDTTTEGVLSVIEKGGLDIWPLRHFRGYDNVAKLEQALKDALRCEKEMMEFKQKVLALEQKFPNLPEKIKKKVYNLDHYYEYSDDISVYRNAKAAHEEVIKTLEELNSKEFYVEYTSILFKKH